MTENPLSDEARAKREAQLLLEHPAFTRTMDDLREGYVDELASIEVNDPKAADLHAKLRALADIRHHLKTASTRRL